LKKESALTTVGLLAFLATSLTMCFALLAETSTLQADESVRERHICEVVDALPEGSPLRASLQRGARGDGVHHPWMDAMKRVGVKRATVEIIFTWRGRPEEMKVVRRLYFGKYDCACGQIKDSAVLEHIRAIGLEREIEKEALEQTQESYWIMEAPRHARGRRGTSYVEFLDDEWLPRSRPLLQVIDVHRSPLEQAVYTCDEMTVMNLLAAGKTDSDQLDEALFAAAMSDDHCITQMLLEAGADANARGTDGNTPLMNASGSGRLANVKLLLAAGADPKATNRWGETALSSARKGGFDEIVNVLEEALPR
jgi:hypothetical protein